MITKTIRKYCEDFENIENYDKAIADTENIWQCHHRLEEIYSFQELKEKGLYFKRPAEELIFLTKSEHNSLHKKGRVAWNKGKKFSEETKDKMSKAKKGNKNPMFGKNILLKQE